MIIIGLDDTDIAGGRGTGKLARAIAATLAHEYTVMGIVRHQLLFDPRVPYTAKNSSASILIDGDRSSLDDIHDHVQALMMDDFQAGSDPGLAVAVASVAQAIVQFGHRAKRELVSQAEALALAHTHGILLTGLGGTNDGVIGALASVGLVQDGDDGRYIQVGTLRDLVPPVSVAAIKQAGVVDVRTAEGQPVTTGMIVSERLRPARRGSQPVLIVERGTQSDEWHALKLD